MSFKFGGRLPSGKHLERIRQSPYYNNGGFQNLSPTPMKPEDVSYWKMLREFFKKRPETVPSVAIPFVKTDLNRIEGSEPVIVWFGHSSYFIRIANRNFLIDPVFSGHASPLSWMVKAFPGSNEYSVSDMPRIDYLVLTHDHYDHLDYKTIRQLREKVNAVYCSLGMAAHLAHWGMDPHLITELDWWQSDEPEENIQLTAAPGRHFSGRGLKRGQSLWSSFILKTPQHNLYLGGDSGYDSHFKKIGGQYGPFDLSILEAGQYNTLWPFIHMMPEETVQAAVDLRAKALLPVHWGKFKLSMHAWNEPVKRILKKAEELNVPLVLPKIGEPVVVGNDFENTPWWNI